MYLRINFIVFVPGHIGLTKYPVWRLFFIQKRQLWFRNPSKGLQHPQNMKIKNYTWKDLLYMTKYPIQYSQMDFFFDCAHPQLQLDVHHIAPNLAYIAQLHPLGFILIGHCWKREKSTTPCTPLNYSLSVWVVCLWFLAYIDIPGTLVCFCVTHFLFLCFLSSGTT